MPSALTQRLIWKSFRQSVPLLTALAILFLLLQLIVAFLDNIPFWEATTFNILLLPCLFSVGAGTVLVSMDRDAKVMDWLKSLPVRWHQVVFTPMVVAAVQLVLLWCLVYFFRLLVETRYGLGQVERVPGGFSFYMANSFYVLLCGFASAWMFRSPLPALLGIVPFAAIPTLIEFGREEWDLRTNRSRVTPDFDITQPIVFGIVGVCAVGVILATCGLSRAALYPEAHDSTGRGLRPFFSNAAARLSDFAGWFRREDVQPTAPMARMSSLLWGFYRENRGIFRAGQLAVFVLAGCSVFMSEHTPMSRGYTLAEVIAFLSGLVLLTIPVVTFQADANRDRVRFLTERGIRPRELWWSRQLLTLGVVSLFLVVMTWLGLRNNRFISQWFSEFDSWALFFVLVFNAYAMAQWIGQVVHRVTLAIVISLVTVPFCSAWIVDLKPSLWAVLLSDLVLLAATYRMMMPWMERRIDWRYWIGHAKYAALVAAMFVLAWIYHWVAYRAEILFFHGEVIWRSDWEMEAQVASNQAAPESFLSIRGGKPRPIDWQSSPLKSIKDPQQLVDMKLRLLEDYEQYQRSEFYTRIESQLTIGGVQFDDTSVHSAYELVGQGERLRLDAMHLSSLDTNVDAKAKYAQWVQLMVRVASGLRQSHHLYSQEIADQFEIWLIGQCLEADTRRLIDDKTFDTICNLVGNAEKRWDGRRRALLVSGWRWRQGNQQVPYPSFLPTKRDYPYSALRPLVEYIEASKLGRGRYPGETLAALSGMAPEHFGIGVGADWIRIDDARKYSFTLGCTAPVAMFWGAGWEQQGKQLRDLAGVSESTLKETAP